ncbi:ZPR1-related zinc finger protein [Trichomonas vaginalis G3]|uniref:ZPR1-related zinc finger protein n=1 Tax=Trichomonas vaginalis (strain ATCC PRA-98 / G3) TaxID=412133 RepID=A2DPT9_TRIV3|nr:zinc finger protein ZPR1 family [Trichomonas vaginalis G3]EAY17535.1 ZPR1-related zinc finger protein [Trichomonas vaginalis G3]KAI5520579.1 zinc finger protein ZPR1 family [Trichomonas vaginalis G3]|eukprot:XP_001329670.1 ZPR1-related zinc finger protein [Trichomonas vaginalis G3]
MSEQQAPEVKTLPPIFLDISPNSKPTEMDSLCMNCLKEGTTTMLLTKIPFFREVMISHFSCPHCGYSDNAIQFAGEFPAKGVTFKLVAKSPEDLNRRVIKSSHATIKVPEIDLEIPPQTQADTINTVEGVLERAYKGLKHSNPNPTPEFEEFLDNLDQCRKGLVQFNFIIDDPSGNSFLENPIAPSPDPQLQVEFYRRTAKMNEEIGLKVDPKSGDFQVDEVTTKTIDKYQSVFSTDQPVQEMDTDCPVCSHTGVSRSCTLSIPFFKEIIIMAFNCDYCGYHNGEVMIGGETSRYGRKITLKANCQDDLNREVLKSELAGIEIPEAEIKLVPGTLGGKFTTVEGLLRDIIQQLSAENPFMRGDSSDAQASSHFQNVLEQVKSFADGKNPFTLILDDPMSNSFIQKYKIDDPKPIIEDYERTYEQNEELGLNDIKTEEFVTDADKKE